MRKIRKFLKRILCFVLICSILTCSLYHKEEKEVYAVAIVDDACIGLLLAGFSLVLGTYGVANSGTPAEMFEGVFGEDALDNIKEYFKKVDEAEAQGLLVDLNPNLTEAAIALKKKIKHPVQQVGSMYEYFDDAGKLVVSDSFPYSSGTYYFVKNIENLEFDANVGKYVLNTAIREQIAKAVATATKTVAHVGKNILDWTMDQFKALAGMEVAGDEKVFNALKLETCTRYLSKYKDKTAIFFNDGYSKWANLDVCSAFALGGVILELRLQDGSKVFGAFSAERFNSLNDSYAASGAISVFTDLMNAKFRLACYRNDAVPGITSDYTFVDWKGTGDSYTGESVYILDNAGVTSLQYPTFAYNADGSTGWSAYNRVTPLEGGTATLVNNGVTGNYVVGEVQADGTISYSLYGESSTESYVDGLDTSDVKVRVNGDVDVSDKVIEHVISGTGTVEDINDSIASVTDNVRVVDNTIANGFTKSNNWLENIWNGIKSIPETIVGLFSTLWGWLGDILNAIKDSPLGIISALGVIGSVVSSIPGLIADTQIIEDIKTGVLDIPDAISTALLGIGSFVVDVPLDITDGITGIWDGIKALPGDIVDALSDVGDFILDIPSDITDGVTGIWDGIKSLPGLIADAFRELLKELFLPDAAFFNNWNNKFHLMLADKLPYDTYNNFFDDLKEISRSKLKDITINIYGQECTVLSFKWYYNSEDTINDWIRGIMFVVLVFFNINQMYKLIRNSSLYKVDKYLS